MLSTENIGYLVKSLVAELIPMIAADQDVDYLQAAEILYRSDLYQKLQDPASGLYFQSAGYVYSFFDFPDPTVAAEPAAKWHKD